jgi:3-hydroxyisobutyrate dehydrogenase-like beta-hydroxyacid dehydrogenase
MTSVPKAPHVEAVFLNSSTGLLAGPKTGKILFLELSTIDAGASSAIKDKVEAGGSGKFVDAPCSVSEHSSRESLRSIVAK